MLHVVVLTESGPFVSVVQVVDNPAVTVVQVKQEDNNDSTVTVMENGGKNGVDNELTEKDTNEG